MPIHKHQRDGAVFDCAVSFSTLAASAGAPREHGLAMLGTPGRVCEGLAAPTPPDLGAPPQPPGVCAGLVAPTPPNLGAPPQTPGDFPVAGKVTKGAPRAVPFGIPRCVVTALFALAAHRAGLPSATNPGRFATLSWWANRSFFLPKLHRGSHFLLLIRGSAGGKPPRMLEGLNYHNQYR